MQREASQLIERYVLVSLARLKSSSQACIRRDVSLDVTQKRVLPGYDE